MRARPALPGAHCRESGRRWLLAGGHAMNPTERRLQLDLAAARYLDALDRDDFATMAELWKSASDDHELEAVLREVHAGLLEERHQEELAAVTDGIAIAIERHLPSAEIIRQPDGPIT